MKSTYRPILHPQSGYPGELTHIPGHHRQIMHQGNSGDLKVIGADYAASHLKAMANQCVNVRTSVVKGERDGFVDQRDYFRFPLCHITIFLGTIHKFCTDWSAHHQGFWLNSRKLIEQNYVSTLKNADPNIRIEKVFHHHSSKGGNGSSPGSSGSSSAQAPIKCASSGRLSLISSKVGDFCSSASDIASRTFKVNRSAFASGNFFRRLSNSLAIAVTVKDCHGPSIFSTQFPPRP